MELEVLQPGHTVDREQQLAMIRARAKPLGPTLRAKVSVQIGRRVKQYTWYQTIMPQFCRPWAGEISIELPACDFAYPINRLDWISHGDHDLI